jgi:two-component system C4-dicarboxylate transport response regulator DctD
VQLVHEACARYKLAVPDVPGGLLASLVTRSWPGNVRELRNAADRFALDLDLELVDTDERAADGGVKPCRAGGGA